VTKKPWIVASAVAALTAASAATAIYSATEEYAVGVAKGYETKALLSVGDRVPLTSDPSKQFQMVGIPDGLGAHRNGDGTSTVYMNHELRNTAQTETIVGAPLAKGAQVSRLTIDRTGKVLSAEPAYTTVYQENTLVGPAATVANTTRPFSRFCSGSLAGTREGFDRNIYFANEEDGPAASFDGRGGQAVAIFDGEAHALPKLGRFAWENTLVQTRHDDLTVIMGMEDGPSALDPAVENSQLYLYVGVQDRSKGASVLRRNGLDNGTLYVAVPTNASLTGEDDFTAGDVAIRWVAIPNAGDMDAARLEAASDAVGALRFARPEDGAFNKRNRHEFLFVTTGGAAGANVLGRLYSLALDRKNPIAPATLSVVSNADTIIAAGGDTAISPDNIDVSDKYLMINEDGTGDTRPVMAAKGRDGSIWRFDIDRHGVDPDSAVRVAELNPPGRDGIAVGPGVWETSGIIDAKGIISGKDTWLFDVQAHGPTTAPAPNTVEDGQLLMMVRK
jgi:hypothetical protein